VNEFLPVCLGKAVTNEYEKEDTFTGGYKRRQVDKDLFYPIKMKGMAVKLRIIYIFSNSFPYLFTAF
jgi:uncharacterized membrane protein